MSDLDSKLDDLQHAIDQLENEKQELEERLSILEIYVGDLSNRVALLQLGLSQHMSTF